MFRNFTGTESYMWGPKDPSNRTTQTPSTTRILKSMLVFIYMHHAHKHSAYSCLYSHTNAHEECIYQQSLPYTSVPVKVCTAHYLTCMFNLVYFLYIVLPNYMRMHLPIAMPAFSCLMSVKFERWPFTHDRRMAIQQHIWFHSAILFPLETTRANSFLEMGYTTFQQLLIILGKPINLNFSKQTSSIMAILNVHFSPKRRRKWKLNRKWLGLVYLMYIHIWNHKGLIL